MKLADRLTKLVIAALVGGPVRSVLGGVLVFAAVGYYLGWWVAAAIAVAGIGAGVWSMLQLPARWRPW